MARKRMIDPSFWSDEKLGECSRDERLLFMGLVSNADDEGYGRANPKLLRSSIFPYDDLRVSDLEKWLSHLGGLNLIVLYTVAGQSYYYLPNFLKHQTINKPTKSALPKQDESDTGELQEHYGNATVVLPPNIKEENRREEEKKENIFSPAEPSETPKKSKFIKPTVEEIAAYCLERNNGIDAQRFFDHYEANNWYRGKTKISDWKACVRTWENKNKQQGGSYESSGRNIKQNTEHSKPSQTRYGSDPL